MPNRGAYEDSLSEQDKAFLELNLKCEKGRIVFLDEKRGADKPDTVITLIVGVKDERIIRCPLDRQEALNICRALIESV